MKPRHWLAANWQTWCGRNVTFPIAPVLDEVRPREGVLRTLARDTRGLLVTYVRVDVSCRSCLRAIKMLYPEG